MNNQKNGLIIKDAEKIKIDGEKKTRGSYQSAEYIQLLFHQIFQGNFRWIFRWKSDEDGYLGVKSISVKKSRRRNDGGELTAPNICAPNHELTGHPASPRQNTKADRDKIMIGRR